MKSQLDERCTAAYRRARMLRRAAVQDMLDAAGTKWDPMPTEPFAARLHFIPMLLRGPQNTIVRVFRRYFEQAPGWVLLTTRGRKTGLPRQVLLPCERFRDGLIISSTYGWRSHWIRNIAKDPSVQITSGGWGLTGQAEIVDDLDRKYALVSQHPFFPPAPVAPVHAVLRTVLRPVLVWLLRLWVRPRPIVLVRPLAVASRP